MTSADAGDDPAGSRSRIRRMDRTQALQHGQVGVSSSRCGGSLPVISRNRCLCPEQDQRSPARVRHANGLAETGRVGGKSTPEWQHPEGSFSPV